MARVTTELDIELAKWNAKTTQIKSDMKAMSEAAKKENIGGNLFGSMKGLLAGAGISMGVSSLKGMFDGIDNVADVSAKLNETPETIQRVGVAASLSGTSIESLASAMIKLEKGLGDVENTKAREALERYGFTAEQILSMPLDQKLIALAEAFQKARSEGHGVADIQTLLGKGAAELIPLLAMTGAELHEMFDGIDVLANDTVFRMAALNDQADLLAKNFSTQVARSFMDVARAAQIMHAFISMGAASIGLEGDSDAIVKLRDEWDEAAKSAENRVTQMQAMRTAMAAGVGASADPFKDSVEKQAKEDEAKEKRITGLQADIEKNRIDMLPDDQKVAAFGEKLKGIFQKLRDEVDPFGVTKGVKELIEIAGKSKSEAALQLLKDAQDTQQQMDAVEARAQKADAPKEETQRSARTPGSVAAAMNTIFGRSANELVLDESKRQTQVLERIDKGIQKLAGNGQSLGVESDTFTFP
jgi:hypothetical protein